MQTLHSDIKFLFENHNQTQTDPIQPRLRHSLGASLGPWLDEGQGRPKVRVPALTLSQPRFPLRGLPFGFYVLIFARQGGRLGSEQLFRFQVSWW